MTRKAKKKFNIAGTILHHLESAKMTLLGIPFWVWPMQVSMKWHVSLPP